MKKRPETALLWEKIRVLRFEKKMTLKAVAQAMNLSVSAVSLIIKEHDQDGFGLATKKRKRFTIQDRWPIHVAKEEIIQFTVTELAQKYNVSKSLIYSTISNYKKIKPDWFVPTPQLISVYHLEDKKVKTIVKQYGFSATKVKALRKKFHMQKKSIRQFLDKNSLVDFLENGYTLSDIALHYKTSLRTVSRFAKEVGVVFPSTKRARPIILSEQQRAEIFSLHRQDRIPLWQIAERFDISIKKVENEIYKYRKDHGLLQKKVTRPSKKTLEDHYILYGEPLEEIAQIFSVQINQVKKWLTYYKISIF